MTNQYLKLFFFGFLDHTLNTNSIDFGGNRNCHSELYSAMEEFGWPVGYLKSILKHNNCMLSVLVSFEKQV